MLKVFVCHATQDKQAARDLSERLVGSGYDVWFDERSLLPGQDWEHEIRAAMKDTDLVVVLLSQRSVQKIGFVQREVRLALDAADERPEGSIFIVPVRLDDTPLPSRLERWHWLDATQPGWFDRLCRSLEQAGLSKLSGASDTRPATSGAPGYSGEPVVVDFLGLAVSPLTLTPGQTMELEYRIRLRSSHMLSVELGASLVSREGREYYDTARDLRVPLAPETAMYRRYLEVPHATPDGTYRLIGAVWYPKIGEQRLASLDRGFVVTVGAPSH